MDGRIKYYNAQKGYGFILSEDEEDVFFHISTVKSVDKIRQGQRVKFEYKETEKGLSATKVELYKTPVFFEIAGHKIKISNIRSFNLEYGNIYVRGEQVYLFDLPYLLAVESIQRRNWKAMMGTDRGPSYTTYENQPILTIETYQNEDISFYDWDDTQYIIDKYDELCEYVG